MMLAKIIGYCNQSATHTFARYLCLFCPAFSFSELLLAPDTELPYALTIASAIWLKRH
jgi:hypothetical protein